MVDFLDPISVTQFILALVLEIITSRSFIRVVFFPGFISLGIFAAFLVWYERKLIAKIQLRVGPLYAGGFGGILQAVADGIKLMFKEVIFPTKSDRLLLVLVPFTMVVVAASPLAVIPFGENWYIANLNVGLVFVFAVGSLFPSLVLLVGWASNSKYPFLGGLRALFQQVAYEIPMWISVLGVVILTGSLNLIDIVRAQRNMWFILPQFLGFAVFLVAVLAELERIPFDLPEAEPELVMGWMTEMSGAIFMMTFLALYTKLYVMSALTTALFLGGWQGPGFLPQPVWFLVKTLAVASFFVVIRGVFPRVRMDLLLRVGWTRLLVLALVNLAITIAFVFTGLAGELVA